jgi:putative ABC transport system permease protein
MKGLKTGISGFARIFLQHFMDEDILDTILEDMEHSKAKDEQEKGFFVSRMIWIRKFFVVWMSFVFDSLVWRIIMFRNYLKITLRNIQKHKMFSLINIAGLALGLTFAILIIIFVRYEFSYDRFHKNAENIYRVISKNPEAWAGSQWWNATAGVLKSTLLDNCPEVKKAARLCLWKGIINLRGLFSSDGFSSFESNLYMVDPEFLEIFSFPLVAGDPQTALNEPFSILLTQDTAEKYFGRENPVGRVINADNSYDYTVTGVLKNVPENSHVKFDFLISFATIYAFPEGKEGHVEEWNSQNYVTYLQLTEGAKPEDVEARLPGLIKKYRGERFENSYHLQAMTRIHLHSRINLDLETNSDIRYVYLFLAIAFFILLIACFNYMNLSTARSAARLKEVGIRKVVGADRRQLIRQFMGESLLFAVLALILSLLLVNLLLPLFGRFVERDLHFRLLSENGVLIVLIIAVTLAVGAVAGTYPAFFLSAFKPVNIIKGAFKSGSKGPFRIRSLLVIFQFAISIMLIVCTFIIYSQLDYIKNRDLGFRQDHIVALRIQDDYLRGHFEPLERELLQHPRILDVTVSDDLPCAIRGGGGGDWEGKKSEDSYLSLYNTFVGYGYLDFYGLKLTAGRNFSRSRPTDKNAYILNETAVKTIGWDNPLGKKFRHWKDWGTVIGVVQDFHFFHLHQKIDSVVISLVYEGDEEYLLKYARTNYLSIKISSEDVNGTLAFVEKTYKKHTEYPFDFTFLDERIDSMYRSEQRLGKSFIAFSLMAVSIACLGLFGLASFTAEQKTKEIGIRRILGASIPAMVVLLIRIFLRWLLFSSLIACPIAYYAMNRWMYNFAYRAEIPLWIFLAAPVLAALTALLTVGFQSVKAAVANPADCLRYE